MSKNLLQKQFYYDPLNNLNHITGNFAKIHVLFIMILRKFQKKERPGLGMPYTQALAT